MLTKNFITDDQQRVYQGVYQRLYHRVFQPPASVGQAIRLLAVSVSCLPTPACGCQGLTPRCFVTPGNLRSVVSRGSLSVAPPAMGGRFPSSLHRKLPGLPPRHPTNCPTKNPLGEVQPKDQTAVRDRLARRSANASCPLLCFVDVGLFLFSSTNSVDRRTSQESDAQLLLGRMFARSAFICFPKVA